jgi:hypothetical protein
MGKNWEWCKSRYSSLPIDPSPIPPWVNCSIMRTRDNVPVLSRASRSAGRTGAASGLDLIDPVVSSEHFNSQLEHL